MLLISMMFHISQVGRIEYLLGRVPLFPCFDDKSATSTIPHKYSPRLKQAFALGCADGSGQGCRWGSHVYEITPSCGTLTGPSLESAGCRSQKPYIPILHFDIASDIEFFFGYRGGKRTLKIEFCVYISKFFFDNEAKTLIPKVTNSPVLGCPQYCTR